MNLFEEMGVEGILTPEQKRAEELNVNAEFYGVAKLDINSKELKKEMNKLEEKINKLEKENEELLEKASSMKIEGSTLNQIKSKMKEIEVEAASKAHSLKLEKAKANLMSEGVDIEGMTEKDIINKSGKLDEMPKFPFGIYSPDSTLELDLENGKRYELHDIKKRVLSKYPNKFYLDKADVMYNQLNNAIVFKVKSSTKGAIKHVEDNGTVVITLSKDETIKLKWLGRLGNLCDETNKRIYEGKLIPHINHFLSLECETNHYNWYKYEEHIYAQRVENWETTLKENGIKLEENKIMENKRKCTETELKLIRGYLNSSPFHWSEKELNSFCINDKDELYYIGNLSGDIYKRNSIGKKLNITYENPINEEIKTEETKGDKTMRNLTNEQKVKLILENFTDEAGDIDLLDLDFGDKIVFLSYIKARKIYNNGQEAEEIDNNRQVILPKYSRKSKEELIKIILELEEK